MGTAIKDFQCKVSKKIYRAGDTYDGDRQEELQELGYVSKEETEDPAKDNTPEWPKHVGFGRYELSNGDKIKGTDAAIAAQAEIDASSD